MPEMGRSGACATLAPGGRLAHATPFCARKGDRANSLKRKSPAARIAGAAWKVFPPVAVGAACPDAPAVPYNRDTRADRRYRRAETPMGPGRPEELPHLETFCKAAELLNFTA